MWLDLELCLDHGPVKSALDLSPLDVRPFYSVHGKEQVFNQKQLLDLHRVLAERHDCLLIKSLSAHGSSLGKER